MRGFDIGLSALRTHQRTLNTIGNNIANASTPGYHRQRVNLVTRAPQIDGAHLVGTGVDVGSIERLYDVATEAAILRNQAQLGQVGAELDVANSIEGLFTPGDSSIHANLSDFFNNLEAVANSPEVQTVRSEFLTSSENLLYQFGRLNSDLEQHRQTVISEVTDTVNLMNGLINDVADLNHEIQIARISGRQPNDLLDRRDSIVSQLTQWADVDIQTMKDGREVVLIGGATVTVGKTTDPIIAEVDSNGQLSIRLASQSR
ncbi:MAG: flagellar hook-associated protein FlgK, partial [Fuerstiella sp.]